MMDLPYTITEEANPTRITKEQTARKTVEDGDKYYFYVETHQIPSQSLICLIRWDSGFMEVKADITDGTSNFLSRLEHGLRIGIETYPIEPILGQMRVRQARIKPETGHWSNVYKCSKLELDQAAGFEASSFLESKCRYFDIGPNLPHKELYKTRDLVAIFDKESRIIPIHIFTISRILPILNEKRANNQLTIF